MKTIRYYVLLSLTVYAAACSPKIHVDQDEGVDLSTFKAYNFVDGENVSGPNPLYHSSLLDNAIHAEIAGQLERRGLREDSKNPDMLVAYHTYTERKQASANNYYPMMYGGWGWQYYPWGFGLSPYPYGYWNGYAQTYTYTEGTLIIDIINAKTKTLVWRGSVSDAVNDPADLHKKAMRAVDQIFKKFPLKEMKRGDQPLVSGRP